TVERVPTVADLRARRLELIRAALRESLLTDDLDPYRAGVESLAEEFDLTKVALAAVKLAQEAAGGTADEEDIPEVVLRRPREDRPARRPGRRGGPDAGMTRLFVGLGRRNGIRPQDLVGAIAGESGL